MFNRDLIKSTYSTDEGSLLEGFYLPTLKEAVSYDRAVGYFSSTMLSYALQGLDGFVRNSGKIRLVIGEALDEYEYKAIKEGAQASEIMQRMQERWEVFYSEIITKPHAHRLQLLAWLVKYKRIEIKYAFRRAGMYHEKIGVMHDNTNQVIVFQGSMNETTKALLPDFNFESISVYPSWKTEIFNDYAIPYINRFEKLWRGDAAETIVLDMPSEQYELISTKRRTNELPRITERELVIEELSEEGDVYPRIPKSIGGQEYILREHQLKALNAWKASDWKGVFKLATGAGKTITAIHAAVALSKKTDLAFIVAVPYQVLADQWIDVLKLFNIFAIKCYSGKSGWLTSLENEIGSFNLNDDKKFIAAVVVNATFKTQSFQEQLNRINPKKLLFVGDECHHHGGRSFVNLLPEANFKIGLSATPWARSEKEKREIIEQYYGQVVAEYSIDDAINDKVLTPYIYNMNEVNLTSEEFEEYSRLSSEINKLIAIKESGGFVDDDSLRHLLMSRSRLIGSAQEKFEVLNNIVAKTGPSRHTLFYCGDGSVETDGESDDNISRIRDVERVATILKTRGWRTSRFTAEETSAQRKKILDNFKNVLIDAVVAIRVLDEGFDLPVCREAYLLASSRNERQFIQRRGRILRNSPGKEEAIIHDFVVLPAPGHVDQLGVELVRKELTRAFEFIRVSKNKDSVESSARRLAGKYGINYEEVISEVLNLEESENEYGL